jgi:hypothetical protein
MILSFVRGQHDTVAPVIPAGRFARMTRVRLATAAARGSLYGPPVPTGSPPPPIFTESGWYLAIIGTDFAHDDNGPFGTCWFHYVNHRRPQAHAAGERHRPYYRKTGANPSGFVPAWPQTRILRNSGEAPVTG